MGKGIIAEPQMSLNSVTNANHARECRTDLIERYHDRIFEAAVPEWTQVSGRKEQVSLGRKFYPIEDLRKIFTLRDVKEILSHECQHCQRHLADNRTAHPSQYPPEKILKTDAAVSLFALLVLLRYPLLIGIFLASYDLDSLPLPRYFSLYDLKDRLFKHLPYNSKEKLAAEFQEKKWQFSVPKFEDGSFQSYEDGTILPFLNEKPIGSGGYGKVFKVWIHPHYCTLGPRQVRQSFKFHTT